jgi:hypothetical protein
VSPSVGGFRNDLIIRGGAPNETVYYLDGMEIPNINHFSTRKFWRSSWVVKCFFIEDVSLSASALEQNMTIHFRCTAIQQRTGNTERFNNNFRISASEAFTSEGPFKKTGKKKSNTSYIASRRSYLYLFEAIGLPIRTVDHTKELIR